MSVPRETVVIQSVLEFVQDAIDHANYGNDAVVLDGFPDDTVRDTPLENNMVAVAFDFGPDSEDAELGSALQIGTYTIEVYIFGQDETWLPALSSAIRSHVTRYGYIPLLDLETEGHPVVDGLENPKAATERLYPEGEPRAWEMFMQSVTITVEHTFMP